MYNFSYSQSTTLQDCERKYFLKYIIKQPIDKDFVQKDYFTVGQAFHKVMEVTYHGTRKNFEEVFSACMKEYEAKLNDTDKGVVWGMCAEYTTFFKKTGLEVVAVETRYEPTGVTLIIDAIVIDTLGVFGKKGLWYILDLKTASSFDQFKPATLARDPQLNLYAAYRGLVILSLKRSDISEESFGGVALAEVSKAKLKFKDSDTIESYGKRCAGSSKVRLTYISRDNLLEKYSFSEFNKYYARRMEIFKEFESTQKTTTRCNFQNCVKWGSPCEYFSCCH